jgi:hypothetical protein
MLVFRDGRELPLSGTVLDYAPDGAKPEAWDETDGSAGLRGYLIASDKHAEAKAILAVMTEMRDPVFIRVCGRFWVMAERVGLPTVVGHPFWLTPDRNPLLAKLGEGGIRRRIC